jgi:hypothetical protein
MKTDSILEIAGEAVERKLKGFPSPLAAGWDCEKLAKVVQDALENTLTEKGNHPDRIENIKIRKILKTMRSQALKLKETINIVDDDFIKTCLNSNNHRNFISYIIRTHPNSEKIPDALQRILVDSHNIIEFSGTIIDGLRYQKAKWRERENRNIRVMRGIVLIPIYEDAFDQLITINNWQAGDARHQSPTPFMNFYQWMVELGFGERKTSNLRDILTAARDERGGVKRLAAERNKPHPAHDERKQ